MYAAIDFGTTNTDVVIHSAGSELNFYTFQTQNVNLEFIDKIFKEISIDLSKIKSIAVTGGKSSNLENSYEEIPIEKINEIDAIALGKEEKKKTKQKKKKEKKKKENKRETAKKEKTKKEKAEKGETTGEEESEGE